MQYVGPAVRPSVTLSHEPRQPRLWPVVGSLLLLSISYLLLTAAPAVSQQLRSLAGYGRGGMLGTWALALASTGLLLGGAAALVLVLVQLAADARRRPYVYLSPVLAAFSACILVGLEAKLPLASVSAEHLAVFALIVAVVGGALIQDPRPALQRTGLILTLWPSFSLMLMVWAATGEGDPAVGLWMLGPVVLGYLLILTVSSFAIAATSLIIRSVEAPSSSARSGPDVIGVQDLAAHATRAGSRLTSFWKRDLPRLHKPLLAVCGIVLAVGVVRAIVGASSGREEALAPAQMEQVAGPIVSPWMAPTVEQPTGRQRASAQAETASKVSERMLTNAAVHAVAHEEPRARRERAPRSARRGRARPAKPEPAAVTLSASAPTAAARVVAPLGDDDWNQAITASKQPPAAAASERPSAPTRSPTTRALPPSTPASQPASTPPTPASTPAPAAPPSQPGTAPKPASPTADPGLDALMNDVLRAVK